MVIDVGARVRSGTEHMTNRIGASIQYKRYRKTEYDPETGATKRFWETPTFNAIPLQVQIAEIDSSKGRLQQGDIAFVFRASEFTSQGSEDDARPTAGDEIIYNGETYEVDLGSGQTLYKEDVTGALFTVYARRKNAS